MASSIEAEIKARIAKEGPISVAEYMRLCLTHYYRTRNPFGARGDFITAPEVSQMFGELIGLWMASVWQQMGAPKPVRIVELGPGRGTLMADALRAAKAMSGFHDAISVHLIEISPLLRTQQEDTLRRSGVPIEWHDNFEDLPNGPSIVIANEFFDALPLHQAVKRADGWHERRVGFDPRGRFVFAEAPQALPAVGELIATRIGDAENGAIFEWRDPSAARALGARVARGGAALVIDYGHTRSGFGDTLQAIGAHAFADPLSRPGELDLTAHVDFEALVHHAAATGAQAFGPIEQGDFLRRLGIETRAAKLKANATPAIAADVDAGLRRLTGSGPMEMGRLFKVVAFAHPSLGVPAGFE